MTARHRPRTNHGWSSSAAMSATSTSWFAHVRHQMTRALLPPTSQRRSFKAQVEKLQRLTPRPGPAPVRPARGRSWGRHDPSARQDDRTCKRINGVFHHPPPPRDRATSVAAVLLSLSACSNAAPTDPASNAQQSTPREPKTSGSTTSSPSVTASAIPRLLLAPPARDGSFRPRRS